MTEMNILKAAKLVAQSYEPANFPASAGHKSIDKGDVQAILTRDNILLLPGSNSAADYLKFNLRLLNLGNRRLKLVSENTEKGFSRTIWHQGFLSYAKVVFEWLGPRKPDFIIGHSLGAAVAQILSKSYEVPALAFAAPRPKKARGKVKHDRLCLSVLNPKDPVCDLPPGFSHMGPIMKLTPEQNAGFPHSMKHYIKILGALETAGASAGKWPRPF